MFSTQIAESNNPSSCEVQITKMSLQLLECLRTRLNTGLLNGYFFKFRPSLSIREIAPRLSFQKRMIYLNSILHKFSEIEMTCQESLCLIVQRCSKPCLFVSLSFREDGKGAKTFQEENLFHKTCI